MKQRNVIIMGAAGRDFHNFNVFFRNNPAYKVICFTAEQIPGIANRQYPSKLAGKKYPKGIPILPESQLPQLIEKYNIQDVFLSYSDLSHLDVMHKASLVMSCGASFSLLGPKDTQIKAKVPIIAITAVRTGSGKSQTSRKVAQTLKQQGYRVIAVRHPMPYGNLIEQECQRFSTERDLVRYKCTIEEQEEYAPWIEMGIPIYAGVDYEKILRQAEKEADVIIWDGGNNDFSFYQPDLHIVVVDPHRPNHEIMYHPGETNFLSADVLVINKEQTASQENIQQVVENCKKYNPKAQIIHADSIIHVDHPERIEGKKVLVVEDGPTLTHGGMTFGAGMVAAQKYKGKVVDAQKHAVGSIKEVYKKYPHLKNILPAMGYSTQQIKELEMTVNNAECDIVIDGSPVNLKKVIASKKQIINVTYTLQEKGHPTIEDVLKRVKIKKK